MCRQKAMVRAADIEGEAHDLAAIIDPDSIGPRGARDINRREGEREGPRCADQKSEKRRESRGEAKECLLKNFLYVGVGFTYSFGKFWPAAAKKCRDQGLLFFLRAAAERKPHQGEERKTSERLS
jgi:hypothetical protein